MSVAEIAAACEGTVYGDESTVVDGASIDSRAIGAGQLFVPIVAERDGHDFVPAAVEGGAAAFLTDREPTVTTVPSVRVADTALALRAVGKLARTKLPDRVIGVTGSVGKTSTKDLLAVVLSSVYRTAFSEKSFNNELGLPLTLAGAPDDTEAVVVEMGARGVGHIALLCDIARPTAGIVTRVEGVHLELFGSIGDVTQAKGELVESLPDNGFAILNADDPRVASMTPRTSASVLTYGLASSADVTATDVSVGPDLRPAFTLRTPDGSAPVQLVVRGEHQVSNALAAAAAATAVGVPVQQIADALGSAEISGLRMQLERTASGAAVLNDAYNANPTSMNAAMDALLALPAQNRIAVVGVMAELGDDGKDAHALIAERAVAQGVRVIAVDAPDYGPLATHVADVAAAIAEVGELAESDALLVKGSRVAALERVAHALVG